MDECDSELVRRGVRGDAQALHAIVDQHGQALFAVACSLLGPGGSADAEDLVQETFLACFSGLKSFEGRSSLRTWLVSILMRQVASRRRQRRAMVSWSDELSERAMAGGGAAGVRPEMSHTDARLDLAAALGGMTAEQREVLMLREYGGLSYEEIATTLGLPRGTVESRMHRARQELARRLKGYTEP